MPPSGGRGCSRRTASTWPARPTRTSRTSPATSARTTYRGEQIEVWDAHAHMGEREQLAIHQIPRIMAFMPDAMIARMDECDVDVVTPFAIGAGNKTDYAETNRLVAQAMRDHPGR